MNPVSPAVDPVLATMQAYFEAKLAQATTPEVRARIDQERVEAMARARVNTTGRAAIQIDTLAKIRQANYPVPRPIVRGLFAEGETILLIGKPKIGKSRLTQQLTLCMSRGERFLGHTIDRAHRVLYLDLENRKSGVQARFRVMSAPHERDENIFVYAPQTLAENAFVASSAGIGELGRVVDEFRPDVLIIDPWRLFVGGDGNKEDVVMNGLKVLSEVRQHHPDLAIILIHHLRKQSEAYGKGAMLRHDPWLGWKAHPATTP